jgi:hypothetical protein
MGGKVHEKLPLRLLSLSLSCKFCTELYVSCSKKKMGQNLVQSISCADTAGIRCGTLLPPMRLL